MLLRLIKIQLELFSDSVENSLCSSTLPLVLYLEFLYDLQNSSPIEHVTRQGNYFCKFQRTCIFNVVKNKQELSIELECCLLHHPATIFRVEKMSHAVNVLQVFVIFSGGLFWTLKHP